jgi:hypothetical protein
LGWTTPCDGLPARIQADSGQSDRVVMSKRGTPAHDNRIVARCLRYKWNSLFLLPDARFMSAWSVLSASDSGL